MGLRSIQTPIGSYRNDITTMMAHATAWKNLKNIKFKGEGDSADYFTQELTAARLNGEDVMPALETINGISIKELGIPPAQHVFPKPEMQNAQLASGANSPTP